MHTRTDFKKRMEDTLREKEQGIAKTVVKVIKEEYLLRDTVEKKKFIIALGLKEVLPIRHKREEHEKKLAVSVMMAVQDEGERLSDEIEEVIRLGKYIDRLQCCFFIYLLPLFSC